jgi:MoaA/NifB/PqqE/SkfB family radical SAM enzyme
MGATLYAWQHAAIRNNIDFYRRAHAGYGVTTKRAVDLDDGTRAFSPLHPPIGSRVARRRVRLIVQHMSEATTQGHFLPPATRVPHVATVAITYACQCDCGHCSAESLRKAGTDAERRTSHNGIGAPALTYDEITHAIRQTVSLGTTSVILTGGEPLLHPRVCDIVRSVDRQRALCTMFTNGEYLDEQRVARLKDAGIFGIFVSLDHATAAPHDGNRTRPGLFDKAVQGLVNCGNAGVPSGISTYVTREKLASGEMDALMELGRELGVLEVFIFDVTPAGRLSDHADCLLDDAELDEVRKFRARYHELSDYPRIIHQTMFSAMVYPCVAEGCPAAMVQLHIRANGDVTPCDFTPQAFGNLRRQPLADIWAAMAGHDLFANASPRCRLSHAGFRASLAALPAM